MKLSIIIPTYNEAATLPEIIRRVKQVKLPIGKEIIVVDDGSADRTRRLLAKTNGVETIIMKRNQGKGAAIRAGLAAATGSYVLIQDADLEYDPQDLKALLEPVRNHTADISLGSRARFSELKNIHTGWSHPHPLTYLGNKLIIASINLLYGRKGTDFFACYKIIPRRYMLDLPIEADGFSYDVELLCKLFRKGLRVAEVPIHYNPRTFAEGKKIRYRDGIKVLWTLLKWRFKSF